MGRRTLIRGEEGQAAVFLTLLLMFAFIALTALAIDGGHLYVVRRDLQNMADAACLAAGTQLSLGEDNTIAYQAAVDYVLANGGWEDLYTPLDGDGEGLIKGIQVTNADIRVALLTEVPTYFTTIFNRTGAGVSARAHCKLAGGLLPIAVRRYRYNEDDQTQQLDLLANQNCLPTGCYYHGPEGLYRQETWQGRYGPTTVWLPENAPSIFAPGNVDCDPPPIDDVYVGTCVLGDGVSTNDGTANFNGFVLLDVRNIAPGPVEYLSGATGQADINKDISKSWLCEGYANTPPMVGDQLAMLDGVSNDFAADEMSRCWDIGESFAAVVYSGFVWASPDVELSIEPSVNESIPATYVVTLRKTGPTPWEEDAVFGLTSEFMEEPTDPITVTFSSTSLTLPWGQSSASVQMMVDAAPPPAASYLSALTVRAAEQMGPGIKRFASTDFRYGDPGADFTLHASQGEVNVPQDGSVDIYLITTSYGGFDERNVPIQAGIITGPTAVWENVFEPIRKDKIKHISRVSEDDFTLTVLPNAPTGVYVVRFTVAPGEDYEHSVDIVVNVYTPTSGGTPTRFIIVQGFAAFRVSYKDSNTIAAYAISPVVANLREALPGLQARLVPW